MPAALIDSLVDTLRDCGVLSASQISEVRGSMSGSVASSDDLCEELVRRGWLTRFQADRILAGGTELLLGPYVLLDRLGEGGMGEVFMARHTLMDRVVAIKVIRSDRLAGSEAVERFRREIQAVARVSHPNIVTAHDAAQVGSTHFYVMEFLDGTDLARLVKEKGPLPVGTACECIRQAALGLQHVFEQRLVHRDIKPANLVLVGGTAGKELQVKVLDLGLARLSGLESEGAGLTRDGVVMGTPDYLAPEQSEDAHAADIRADIYSLGCTLYHLLTGRPPFPGGSLLAKLTKHREIDPVPADVVRSEVPAALAAVIRKMMAKRPADRYQTPAEVVAALAPFAAEIRDVHLVPTGLPIEISDSAPSTFDQSLAESAPDRTDCSVLPPMDPFADLTIESQAPVPVPAAAERRTRDRRKGIWTIAASLIGALLLIAGGILFFAKLGSKDGKAEIEVLTRVNVDLNDKSLSFSLDDEPKTAAELGKPVELTVGRHVLEAKRGRELVRRVVFRVSEDVGSRFEVEEDFTPAKPNSKEQPPIPPASAVARTVQWTLDIGGQVRLEKGPLLKRGDRIPSVTLRPAEIYLAHKSAISQKPFLIDGMVEVALTDDDLGRLRDLPDSVRLLDLRGHFLTDDGLAHLSSLKGLEELNLFETRVTCEGLRHLARVPLKRLSLGDPGNISETITKAGFRQIASIRTLQELGIHGALNVSDEEFQALRGLPLEDLFVACPNLGDEGLAALRGSEHLRVLRIGWSRVTNEGLKRLGTLKNLETLSIDNSEIDDAGLRYLSSFPALAKLQLGLERYTFARKYTDVAVSHLVPLKSLRDLRLLNTSISDASVDQLLQMKQLTNLNVTGSLFSEAGLKRLRDGLPKCRVLPAAGAIDPARTAVSWVLERGGHVKLEDGRSLKPGDTVPAGPCRPTEIHLAHKSAQNGLTETSLTDDDLARLRDLPDSVRRLDLRGHPITNRGWEILASCSFADHLLALFIQSSKFSDDGLKHLVQFKSLEWLVLKAAGISGTGLEHLKALPKLKQFGLDICSTLDNTNLRFLAGLKIEDLSFWGSISMTNEGLAWIARMPELRGLSLTGCHRITDEGVAPLKKLSKLKSLDLNGTRTTGAGLVHLRDLANLERLLLGGCSIGDADLAALKSLKRLCYLNLAKTQVTEKGFADLQKSLPDCKVE